MNEAVRCMAIWLGVVALLLLLDHFGPSLDAIELYPSANEVAADVRADIQAETKQARVAIKEQK